MDKKLKIGIVGCGSIANAKHMPSLTKLGDVEMVAFCDVVIERAQAAKENFGTPDAKVYADYHDLLNDNPEIDVIHVCTPNKHHAPISIAALEAGKHVMCEKPMAKTAAEAQAMLDAAKRTGKKLTIGYQNRQRKAVIFLKQVCDEGKLGEIYYAKALALRRRGVPCWGVFMNEEEQGGGPLIDIGTHALDMTLWTMNNYEVHSVVGSAHHQLSKREKAANSSGPWDPKEFTVEDSAFGFVKMKNGATIIIESSWARNIADSKEAMCILAGTEGGVDFEDGMRFNGEQNSKLYIEQFDMKTKGVDFYSGLKSSDPAYLEARQWIDCIRNDTDPCVLPEQALVVSQILEAIYTSSKTGETVYFD
jgi:predicted dehydrogenase